MAGMLGSVTRALGFSTNKLKACDGADPLKLQNMLRILNQFNKLKDSMTEFSDATNDPIFRSPTQFYLSMGHFLRNEKNDTIDNLIGAIEQFLDNGEVNKFIQFYGVNLPSFHGVNPPPSNHPDTTHAYQHRFKSLPPDTDIIVKLREFKETLMDARCKVWNGERVANSKLIDILYYIPPENPDIPNSPLNSRIRNLIPFQLKTIGDKSMIQRHRHAYKGPALVSTNVSKKPKQYSARSPRSHLPSGGRRTKRSKRSKRTRRSKN
jgi:hypothetical protein